MSEERVKNILRGFFDCESDAKRSWPFDVVLHAAENMARRVVSLEDRLEEAESQLRAERERGEARAKREFIESLAERVAVACNGGRLDAHYTPAQKAHWVRLVSAMIGWTK